MSDVSDGPIAGMSGDEARIWEASKAIREASHQLGEDPVGRAPGLSDVLSKLAREAPLEALAIAFLVGFVIARRR
jgi:hypothetical protein